jgi:hypothetical protein
MFGYTYASEKPLGFFIGVFGVYLSFGFALPDWGDYEKTEYENHQTGGYRSGYNYYYPDYNSSPILDQRYQIMDWVLGYNVTLIPQILYLPIGVGLEAVKEWRLQSKIRRDDGDGNESPYGKPEWNPDNGYKASFLFEAGLLLRFKTPTIFAPYIFGTYRNVGLSKHSFAAGGGISFAGWADW